MKRYHEEKHIIENRIRQSRRIHASMDAWRASLPDRQPAHVRAGRYRKALRCGGCTRARCQVCHPEKFPKRIPTRQELQSQKDFKAHGEDL
jgi:hypothetical protein